MPYSWHYSFFLWLALKTGRASEQDVNEAVRRILRKKFQFKDVGEALRYGEDAIGCEAHKNLAKEAADKSIVLLKNDDAKDRKPLLPLDKNQQQKVAIIGFLACEENTGDHGSSAVYPKNVVTTLDGMRQHCDGSNVQIVFDDGKSISDATRIASEADVVIVCAGFTHKEEGEYIILSGGDRDNLGLKAHDEQLINSVSNVNQNTAVVMFGGSAIVTENWRHKVPAIVMAWYAGEQGGHAIADILFGEVNPSGKLPCSFPRCTDDLPYFSKNTRFIRYEYLHGYRHLEHHHYDPAYAMGFGLSYTSYQYSNLCLSSSTLKPDEAVTVSVDIENTGRWTGTRSYKCTSATHKPCFVHRKI
ncbi:hypothetical protein CS022_05285 [Veronia nyctiphanis]|uniref:Glycoside hydrolase family 3 C-terminal domain-containing protein n=2 Tax=Veronia nyctiphanis TaxID=1278244 RepID=A0A4Q0YSD4_9GAMM|nr:hypothetical protein CS022_05285 [Veronia nyctiphanis]